MRYLNTLLCIILASITVVCSNGTFIRTDSSTDTPVATSTFSDFDFEEKFSQITTHPEIDLMPSLSSDGKWLLFVSKRSGNMDVWVKSAQGGRAYQITFHQADDLHPCWAPDGRTIFFVSKREDADGDLWRVQVNSRDGRVSVYGKPVKLTSHLGIDDSPAVSPDGKRIAFTSVRDGMRNIWIYDLKKKSVRQLTYDGGLSASWSPDGEKIVFASLDGDLYQLDVQSAGRRTENRAEFEKEKVSKRITRSGDLDALPSWSPRDDGIAYVRYSKDTNGDGQNNPEDMPDIWLLTLPEMREIRLTPSGHYNYFPFYGSNGFIYYISDRSGNPDVWTITSEGPVPRQETAFLQYQFAESWFPLTAQVSLFDTLAGDVDDDFLQMRELAFERIEDYFPDDRLWSDYARFNIAKTNYLLGDSLLANNIYRLLLINRSTNRVVKGYCHYELLKGDILASLQDRVRLEDHLNRSFRIRNIYFGEPEITALLDMCIGELSLILDDEIGALEIFEKIIRDYPDKPDFCALAWIKIAEAYQNMGQTDGVIRTLLKVIDGYPDQVKYVNSAIERILDLALEGQDTGSISGYREIISQYATHPGLAARAQLKIGQKLLQQGDSQAAIAELDEVEQQYPEQRAGIAEAMLLMADIDIGTGDEQQAMNRLNTVVDRFSDVRSGLYLVRAKERLIDLYIRSGLRLRNLGDFELATKRFRDAIGQQPSNIEAHRGFVSCLYFLGRIDEGVRLYERRLSQDPGNGIIQYILGLCYSYKATERSERENRIDVLDYSMLKKSNEIIETALSDNYRLVPAYLTLSFNYEVLEQYESYQRNKPDGFLKGTYQTVVAPLKTVFRIMTFQKEKTPERWYERAIDVLTTAISLNDEVMNPTLEGELALNLAHNYYNLEEFGYEKAYFYYHQKLSYDTTFINLQNKAEIYKRMGHCALVTEDFEGGAAYLRTAIALYHDLGNEDQELLNIKRLALLHQLAEENDEAVEYFLKSAEIERRKGLWSELQKSYRSISFNYQLLHDDEEALRYAAEAAALIREGRVKKVTPSPNWIKVSLLGIEFPIWNLGPIGAGESTAIEGFTTAEERALLYSIMTQTYIRQKDYDNAIAYYRKKLEIYREREDRTAEAIFLNNIGYLFYSSGVMDSAWVYFEKSLEISKKEELVPGILSNVINLGAFGVLCCRMDNSEQRYSERAREYLEYGMALSEKEALFYPMERIHLHILLGNLIYLQEKKKDVETPDDLERSVGATLQMFDKSATATELFRSGLRMAQEYNAFRETAILHKNLGEVQSSVKESWQAFIHFNHARRIALENNYSDLMWRIDAALAQEIPGMDAAERAKVPPGRSAAYYFNEALEFLEAGMMHDDNFMPTTFYFEEVEGLYEAAISYFSNNDPLYALELSERMRAKQYLDVVTSHRLALKKERHKNYIGLARDDKVRISEIDSKIRTARLNPETRKADLDALNRERERLVTGHTALLAELRAEDPELESMVHVNPVSLAQIQSDLPARTMLVSYIIEEDSTRAWLVSREDIDMVQLFGGKQYHQQQFNNFIKAVGSGNQEQVLAQANSIYNSLVRPISDQVRYYENIVIIPDEVLCFIPFNSIFRLNANKLGGERAVTLAQSMASYYYSYKKRKIGGEKLLLTGDSSLLADMVDMGYDVDSIAVDDERVIDKFEDSDIIHMDVEIDWDSFDPLKTQLILKDVAPISDKEIYAFNLDAKLVVLSGSVFENYPDDLYLNALNRATLYAGAPAVLYTLWPAGKSETRRFFSHFYEHLMDDPAGIALNKAIRDMVAANVPFTQWAGYQLFGYQGMTLAEERAYSLEQLEKRVTMGFISFEEGDLPEAVNDYEAALAMAKTLSANNYVTLLRSNIVKTAAASGDYHKAIEYQLEILDDADFNQDYPEISRAYKTLAVLYTENGEYEQALHYQNRYIALMEDMAPGTDLTEAYRKIGLIHERSGAYGKSVQMYSKAIGMASDFGEHYSMAKIRKDRGRVYLLYLDSYAQAIDDFLIALTVFRSEGDDENGIEAMQNAGLGYEKLADYRSAKEYQERALRLAEETGEENLIAVSRQYLANVLWKSGDYQSALQHQTQALQYFRRTGQKKYELIALSTQGLILMSLGRNREGLDLQYQALAIARDVEDAKDQATIYKNIGLHLIDANQYREAINAVRNALEIDREIGYKRGLAYDFRDLARLYTTTGAADSALVFLEEALRLSREIQDHRNEMQCIYERGRANAVLGQDDVALEYFVNAAERAEYLLIPEIQWRALKSQADIYRSKGENLRAVELYESSISVIERMRARIKVEEFQSGFIDDKLDVYGDLIELLLAMNSTEDALGVVERAKSRNFLDMLANRDISFKGNGDAELIERGREIQEKLTKAGDELGILRARVDELTVSEKEKRDSLEDEVASLRDAYEAYLIELKQKNAELADLVTVEPKSIAEIRRGLPGGSGIVEYHISGERLHIWIVSKDVVASATIGVKDSSLTEDVRSFRHDIENQLSVENRAKLLHRILIEPIRKHLGGIEHLIIVPHKSLHYLPFAALMEEDGTYLIDRYSISFAPSATVFDICMKKGDRYIEEAWESRFLALGNPDLGNPALELPFAEKEIQSIRMSYDNVNSYLNSDATESAFKSNVGNANIVLLSCHGEFDAVNPLFSALLLTGDAVNDGRLEAHEIFELDMDASIVAMSACETGLGAIRGGDEVIGLMRSFIYAGSASLLSSLWKVDDLATAVLMKRFFRYMKEPGMSKSEALRQAQRLVRNEINSHPAFWAAFNISGDFRSTQMLR
ncbi:MAG: CHAT domain-containing protein [candidate division KSB1 bacterium]|jgi:CHAT domain-containing protein/Tol biopolymer transport system component/TolA-binding protein|nr:CHAT domain-containing protein [candidate division KSB1 bacterium]